LGQHEEVARAFGVACGMKFLHACGVVHRDLKSLNILLDDDFEAKIGDLGLAKFLHDGEVHTMRIGSYLWMAPGVLHSEFYSEKADVYSYGLLVYELATLDIGSVSAVMRNRFNIKF
jgi:serine/threonine protein kinase